MAFSGPCPRCRGYVHVDRDIYGEYRVCLHCGYMEDKSVPSQKRPARVHPPEKEVA